MDVTIPLRITLLKPPSDVLFCLQKGRNELYEPVLSTGEDIVFSLGMRVKDNDRTGAPNFLGPFAQGTPEQRFFYVCIGQYAGQKDAAWARRAKIHLSAITWQQVNALIATPGSVLAASYEASAPDGSPTCASVPLTGSGWSLCTDGQAPPNG